MFEDIYSRKIVGYEVHEQVHSADQNDHLLRIKVITACD
jgi:hypothetical protein